MCSGPYYNLVLNQQLAADKQIWLQKVLQGKFLETNRLTFILKHFNSINVNLKEVLCLYKP